LLAVKRFNGDTLGNCFFVFWAKHGPLSLAVSLSLCSFFKSVSLCFVVTSFCLSLNHYFYFALCFYVTLLCLFLCLSLSVCLCLLFSFWMSLFVSTYVSNSAYISLYVYTHVFLSISPSMAISMFV
jgi:hypothetical protein